MLAPLLGACLLAILYCYHQGCTAAAVIAAAAAACLLLMLPTGLGLLLVAAVIPYGCIVQSAESVLQN